MTHGDATPHPYVPQHGDPRVAEAKDREVKWLIITAALFLTGLLLFVGPLVLCKAVDIRRDWKALGRNASLASTTLYWVGVVSTVATGLTALMYMLWVGPTTAMLGLWLWMAL